MSKETDALAKAMMGIAGESDARAKVETFLDTGYPELNKAISGRYDGGFPVGRIIEMFGPPSCGKTAVATAAMAKAQQMGGVSIFMDHERSFDVDLAIGMGLDITPGRWLYKKPRTYEDSCDMAIKVSHGIRAAKAIPFDAPICIVFDSLASMIPKSKVDKDAADYNMNDNTALARATSANFNAMALHAEETNTCIIFLNQARTKIGVMFGDPTTTPGGNAPEFYSSVRIKIGRKQITEGEGKNKKIIGQEIGAECIKNKVSRPFLKAAWRFMFKDDGSGFFDVARSLIEYMAENKMLTMSGNYVMWTDGKKYYKKALAQKINDEGLLEELKAMLPSDDVVEEEAA
jgi:recombination protein RecA